MKKWLVLFIVSLYLYLPIASLEPHPSILWLIIALIFISGCVNIINAVIMQRSPKTQTGISMNAIMVLKLCLLPVYGFCLLLFLTSVLMLVSIWFTIPALFLVPLVIAFSYFVLFVSSSLAISRILLLCRWGCISKKQCVIYIILQLFFVLDVIGCIIVSTNERKLAK